MAGPDPNLHRDYSQAARAHGSSMDDQSISFGPLAIPDTLESAVTTGICDGKQAAQHSPSAHNTLAPPRDVQPAGPMGLFDVDTDSLELPGMALIDVNRYVELARRIPTDGFLPLIRAGFDDERASGSPLSDTMEQEPRSATVWQSICDEYFCSMNEEVLIKAIAGNIDLAYQKSQSTGTDIAKYIDKLRDRASFHPSVYVRPLTDINGSAMSLDHYEQMLDITCA